MARTIEFDRNQVLERATEVFWRDGYCKTSVSSLVEATRLNPGSIYSAFKSKEGLFLEALEHYGQQTISKARQCLDEAQSPLDGIKRFLGRIAEDMIGDRSHRGCFLVNTILEMSPHSKKIQEKATQQLNVVEALLADALGEAIKRGELSPRTKPEVLARFVMVNIWGLRVLSKTGADDKSIRQQLAVLVNCLEA